MKLGIKTKRLQIFICYDLVEGLTNEEEYLIFKIESKLFSIGTITLSKEIV
jgi:glycerol-3-phosphate responsive antiterminator